MTEKKIGRNPIHFRVIDHARVMYNTVPVSERL